MPSWRVPSLPDEICQLNVRFDLGKAKVTLPGVEGRVDIDPNFRVV